MYKNITNLNNIQKLNIYQKLKYEEASLITGIDKGTIFCYNNWFLINEKAYYYKYLSGINQLLNELIGSYLAKFFNLPTVSYSLASYNCDIGIISENFRKPNCTYFDCQEFIIYDTNELSLMYLKKICHNNQNYQSIVEDILKVMVFDFYRNETDRNIQNLYFEKKENSTFLAPLFDYEQSFTINRNQMFNSILDFDLPKEKNYISIYTYEIYKYFKKYPQFYENFKKILEIDLEKIINQIITDYSLNIKEDIITKYLELDEKKKQYVKRLI